MTTKTYHAIAHGHTLTVADNGPASCTLTARSPFSGEFNNIDVQMSAEAMRLNLAQWIIYKRLIQNVFPSLNEDEREFILTGTPKADWDKYMSPADEEDYGDEVELSAPNHSQDYNA